MQIFSLYKTPALSAAERNRLIDRFQAVIPGIIKDIHAEFCFYIEATSDLSSGETAALEWLLRETFEPGNLAGRTFLPCSSEAGTYRHIIEVGPRMNFMTAWSANAVSICRSCGLRGITRIERSRRYCLESTEAISDEKVELLASQLFDRMTECRYLQQLTSFETGIQPEPFFLVPLKEEGKRALEKINIGMGLGFDEWDIDYYYDLFVNDIGRNPTNVECFDLSQSNSEHSRHWFFKGKLVVDGREIPHHLIEIIQEPLRQNPGNSTIAFRDNSSAIRGYSLRTLMPLRPGVLSPMASGTRHMDIIFTAETHNFPSGVAPFPGAETGTGGRIRDVQATGRGAHVIAGTAAYCVGNLLIPGYPLPWEDPAESYPPNLATPLAIEIEASNGASDYGNKFGEPLIQGFTRSFGLRMPDGERREWIKPIMFTGGIGQIDSSHTEKYEPERTMIVTKIGGPAYRIGMGGGSASSMIQGQNIAELDFNAVQRGDAEMEQKMNRVIRACIEMGSGNPIISIHDQGAGGNCNVVKELIYPAGARIEIRRVHVGDNTLSVLEIWGAEYQEQNALLIRPEKADLFLSLCDREKVPCAFIGEITGDGFIVLHDETDGSTPVNLHLDKILGQMPQKTFDLKRVKRQRTPLSLPEGTTVHRALDRVLRLLPVGSKRFLTTKVDRSVTGLIVRQQCAGPLQLTVSDVAVVAQSHFGTTGAALSIGEQPVKGLLDPAAMARMSVGEAMTNMVWAKISSRRDIKCSGNWMWAPKLPGEGADLYDAAVALRDFMLELEIAVDGGKDSLSMAARVVAPDGATETVKSPGTLVISAYATCPDIFKAVTPDIKKAGRSRLLFIDLGGDRNRLGGSALAHCYSQVGNVSPDVDDPLLLKRAFDVVQDLIGEGLILAGHDRSDGGLIVALLEMAFSGNAGMDVDIRRAGEPAGEPEQTAMNGNGDIPVELAVLFSEELGLVMEYLPDHEDRITARLSEAAIPHRVIGKTSAHKKIHVRVHGRTVLDEDMVKLRAVWEETSSRLDRLQADGECVEEEQKSIYDADAPPYTLSFVPEPTSGELMEGEGKPKVAIIREEGSNGDREMTSAFYAAGFDTWDVTMTDLIEGRASLTDFRGVVFVGGFSYADVLDSAKGWAGGIRFNQRLWNEFSSFYHRSDTFSLGVCNGCQLMAFLGWIPWQGIEDVRQPRFIRNRSERFESRFASVKIFPGPSIMLQGMENSILGVWVAHGEGRVYFPDEEIATRVLDENLAQVRYVDDKGIPSERYPFNPNGSPSGITGLCSPDGRHLAMMPHPERVFQLWQWGWMPEEWKGQLRASPWLRMFQNARHWCEKTVR